MLPFCHVCTYKVVHDDVMSLSVLYKGVMNNVLSNGIHTNDNNTTILYSSILAAAAAAAVSATFSWVQRVYSIVRKFGYGTKLTKLHLPLLCVFLYN